MFMYHISRNFILFICWLKCVLVYFSRYINRSTKEEQKLAKRLACHVVRRHQTHAMISPWSLMAAVIMQSPEGITSKQLSREVDWLKRLASNLSAKIDWPGL